MYGGCRRFLCKLQCVAEWRFVLVAERKARRVRKEMVRVIWKRVDKPVVEKEGSGMESEGDDDGSDSQSHDSVTA